MEETSNDLMAEAPVDPMEAKIQRGNGLKGFVEAIGAVYPHSQVKRRISYKNIKPLLADLKKVYTAITEDEALENLMGFKEKWGKQYPSCVKSWKENWDILSTFFAYPTEIRKIIYTTNIIEGLNRQFRQITRSKPSFTCFQAA